MSHGVKAIFFDLHGVLVDTADWHRQALNAALGAYLIKKPADDHPVWDVYGGTLRQLDYLVDGRWKGILFAKDDIYALKQFYMQKLIEEHCKPVERIINVVAWAKSKGFKLAVVTNGNRFNAEKMLEVSELDSYFDFIISREDVGEKIKPHPRPYLEARWRLGLGEKEALAIDDSAKGIMSALDARCQTWWLRERDLLGVENFKRVINNCTLGL